MHREMLALHRHETFELEDVVDDALAVQTHFSPQDLVVGEAAQCRRQRLDIGRVDGDAVGALRIDRLDRAILVAAHEGNAGGCRLEQAERHGLAQAGATLGDEDRRVGAGVEEGQRALRHEAGEEHLVLDAVSADMRLDGRAVGAFANDEIEESRIAHPGQRLDGLAMALVVVRWPGHVGDGDADESPGYVAHRGEPAHDLGTRRGDRHRAEHADVDGVVEKPGRRHATMEARHVLDRVATIGEDEIRLGEGVFAQPRQRAEDVDVVDVERVGRALQALGHEPEPGEVDVVEHDRVVTLRCERGERARHRV